MTEKCSGHLFWDNDTPMNERLKILREKAIYCPYCGKLRPSCVDDKSEVT